MKMETEYSTLQVYAAPDDNKSMIIVPYKRENIPVYCENVRKVLNKQNEIILTHIPSKKGRGDGKCMYFYKYHDDIFFEISTLSNDNYRRLQKESSKSDLSDIKIPVKLTSNTKQLRFNAEYLKERIMLLYSLDATNDKNGQNDNW